MALSYSRKPFVVQLLQDSGFVFDTACYKTYFHFIANTYCPLVVENKSELGISLNLITKWLLCAFMIKSINIHIVVQQL